MFLIFFVYIILISGLIFFRNKNLSKTVPVLISSTASLIGIVLYELATEQKDYFYLFELLSIGMFTFAMRDVEKHYFMKFISYIPILFLGVAPDNVKIILLAFYVTLNIVNLSISRGRYSNEVKIPIISFHLYSILVFSKIIPLENIYSLPLVSFIILISVLILSGFRKSVISRLLINILIGNCLIFLTYSNTSLYLILILFLIYTSIEFLSLGITELTFNNVLYIMVCLSIIPMMRNHLFLCVLGIGVLSYYNYTMYKKRVVTNELLN
jgi:hypothetical protein